MAPMRLTPDDEDDDDFIRTLSDGEPEQLSTGQITGSTNVSKIALKSNKRKHGKLDADSVFDTTRGSQPQKRRKSQSAPEPVEEESVIPALQDQLEEEGLAENDGLDSDFEFQMGEEDNAVVEDLNGWLADEGLDKDAVPSQKRGVDLDALIARRRDKSIAGEATNLNGSEGRSPDSENEAEGSEEQSDSEAGSHTDIDISGTEDEMLAEDSFGMGAAVEPVFENELESTSDQDEHPSSDEEAIADPMPELEEIANSSQKSESDDDDEARREAFFAPEEVDQTENSKSSTASFQNMQLSRPILRGLAAMTFNVPTPIQRKTIPIALSGKDVVGGAVTGSGKTAAFIIPILERLLYRPKKIQTSRVAILMPTRELSVQCFNVAKKLASFTDITFSLLTGGFSLREQEMALRKRPDVIIATPGRFIDHMRNSASFTVDTLEILVLDEADRMLDDGFADELDEILRTIPQSRQTMLFSATMTDQVDKLIRVGLRRPVRLFVDAKKQTVGTLTQEFVRLRPGREEKRLGYLMHLCSHVFKERTIVFFRQKKEAHRARVVFGLCGIKATELHGSMTQEQRIAALASFRNNQATHLLATDLASRGLDIPHVSVVINYEAPQSHEIYLHRVGRTARAGRAGRSCTLAAESDRKVVKQAVRAAKLQGAKIASRIIDPPSADSWASKITEMEEKIKAILIDEKEEKLLNQTDLTIRKGENLMKYEDEIKSRPKRTWFESEKEKLKAKKAGIEELNGRIGLAKSGPKGKLSRKEKKGLDDKRERKEGKMWKKGKGDAAQGKMKPQKLSKSKNRIKAPKR